MRRLCLAIVLALSSLSGCAHDSSLNAREAGAAQLVHEVEENLRQADKLTRTGEDLDRAGELLKESHEKTEDRAMAFYADRENLEDRISQADSRLAAAREARLRREVAALVPERKEKVDAALVEFRGAADALQDRPTLARPKTQRARETLDAVTRLLDDAKRLEIDAAWKVYSQGARKELAGRVVQLTLAESILSFVEGPVARNAEAKAAFDKGKSSKKAEEKAALLTQARDAWLACGKDAAALIAQAPALERETLQLPGAKATAKSFAAACETQAKSADSILTPASKTPAKPAKPATPAKPPAKPAPAKPAPKK